MPSAALETLGLVADDSSRSRRRAPAPVPCGGNIVKVARPPYWSTLETVAMANDAGSSHDPQLLSERRQRDIDFRISYDTDPNRHTEPSRLKGIAICQSVFRIGMRIQGVGVGLPLCLPHTFRVSVSIAAPPGEPVVRLRS